MQERDEAGSLGVARGEGLRRSRARSRRRSYRTRAEGRLVLPEAVLLGLVLGMILVPVGKGAVSSPPSTSKGEVLAEVRAAAMDPEASAGLGADERGGAGEARQGAALHSVHGKGSLTSGEAGEASSDRARIVVVRPGDTLWGIAKVAAMDRTDPRALVDAIRKENQLDTATLKPGQALRMPEVSRVAERSLRHRLLRIGRQNPSPVEGPVEGAGDPGFR
ncbi:MAG: LysM peptidoglycan-binding domain-containing protein [Firmicutes bacterium]|nr:LysM peptidoglycan-binding domain-containing protein [Bacillota bacterium]